MPKSGGGNRGLPSLFYKAISEASRNLARLGPFPREDFECRSENGFIVIPVDFSDIIERLKYQYHTIRFHPDQGSDPFRFGGQARFNGAPRSYRRVYPLHWNGRHIERRKKADICVQKRLFPENFKKNILYLELHGFDPDNVEVLKASLKAYLNSEGIRLAGHESDHDFRLKIVRKSYAIDVDNGLEIVHIEPNAELLRRKNNIWE